MLTCRELTELVTDYLEGQLPLRQRLAFHMHIGMCSHCRRYLKQMRLTVDAMGKLPAVELPQDVSDELLERFRSWKRDRS